MNGKWLKSTPIPDDRTSGGTGSMVDKANEAILVGALDEALDYYRSGMNTAAIEEAGLKPPSAVMQRIARAAGEAKAIFALETELARSSRTRVELRDDEKNYNKRTLAQLEAAAPGFPWSGYFKALGAQGFAQLNVAQPDFFAALARLARERPAAEWQAYLRWDALRSAAATLPAAFEKESFAFNEAFMKGSKAQPPRFRHVIGVISGPYGKRPMAHALAQIYVGRAFRPHAKARALEMVNDIKAALGDRLRTLDWMGDETRARALEKLGTMNVKIGLSRSMA